MILSVLDQSPISSGGAADAAIRESLVLARECEALGYARYWVAEHHNSDSIAGSAPEILIGAIAATTSRIRVGSAGIMLPHYSALKVAEQFRVLEAIAPGRIDLGLGRAPGSDGRTAFALNPQAATASDHFPAMVRDLAHWLQGERLVEGHPFRDIRAQPAGSSAPQMWILGSSDYGAQVAAHFGLPFCFAHFITDGAGMEHAFDIYRRGYRPSEAWPTPHAALTVWALAARTEEEADTLVSSRLLARLWRDTGRYAPLPSPAEAAAWPLSDLERAQIARIRGRAIFGTAPSVVAKLNQLAALMGIDEIAILTAAHDPLARRRSYALIAEAAGMTTSSQAA